MVMPSNWSAPLWARVERSYGDMLSSVEYREDTTHEEYPADG